MRHSLAIWVLFVALLAAPSFAAERTLTHRWIYAYWNFHREAAVQEALALFPRAEQAGYNGIVVSGFDGSDTSEAYVATVRRVQEAAKEHGIELIPTVLAHNSGIVLGPAPDLAEGLPVKDALFAVTGTDAALVPDPEVQLPCGDFEQVEGDQFAGWDLQDNAGKSIFADHEVVHGGKTSARMEKVSENGSPHGHSRFAQFVKVKPFRQYHVSVWIRTQDFDGGAALMALAPVERHQPLGEMEERPKATQDWTRYDILFNSLQFDKVNLFLGLWGGKSGRIWWDDVRLEEVGLLNLVRRAGCPLTVRGEDGTVYQEGEDFAPVRDPALTAYSGYHTPPTIHVTAGSRIRDGQHVRVSYYHALYFANYCVSCLSEPKTYGLLHADLVGINNLLHPRTFFMYDDEVRIANWDEICQKTGLTPGQQLAEKVRRSTQWIRELNPQAEIWDWNDMFDPMHNAVGDYYAVNGSWAGSWEGLDPSVGIANWAHHLQGKNAKFFADRGHKQILAGYYDGSEYPIEQWLEATKDVPGVVGVMYTTWRNNYDDIESWAKRAWGDSPPPARR
jgi:hypothetical protein